MINVAVIVEGYGDVAAVPQLLAKIGMMIDTPIVCKNPIRAGEWKRLRAEGVLEKYLSLAASRQCDQILVLLDLDDGCCANEYAAAVERIEAWDNGRDLAVGLAFFVREYEALFLACADDLNATFVGGIVNPEGYRDAKGQMRQIIGRRYKETQDQVSLTRRLELPKLVSRCRSFRKLMREVTGSDYETIAAMGL